MQTLIRYKLPVVVIVFNNDGVYGGDRRSPEEITGPFQDDPAPTSFVPGAAYHTLIEAFGGKGYLVPEMGICWPHFPVCFSLPVLKLL